MSTPRSTGWELRLGEAVVIEPPGGPNARPNRKQAALLAYLAREGPTPRSRLAELLWPDAASGRASLRQALHDLKQHGPVVDAGDPVALADAVTVVTEDAWLLEGHDFSDCPAFDEWLRHRREADRAALLERLRERIEMFERTGRAEQALSVARRALALDPLSEIAHRRVMRLAYLAGDRAGAIATYRRCEAILRDELGVRPLPETVALAQAIEEASVERLATRHHAIPVTVDRPPVLAGRSEAWDRMEEAWSKGQVIYISGDPGVGKTRLMHDFAASKVPRRRWNVFTARPGDKTTPFASQARAFRAVLDACDGIELTNAMKRELGRLLPEYARVPPKPMSSLEEKNFFYAMLAEVLILSGEWLDCWIADDWQFVDTASLEMASYMFANVTPVATDRKGQRAICTFRTHEVGDDFRSFLADLVRGGAAIHIQLEPLERDDVSKVLASTGVTGVERLATSLHAFTGGNPLFVVETLKSLLEAGEIDTNEERLTRVFPDRVKDIFQERFRRLSWSQLRLLQFLEVAQTDASAQLARIVLGLSPGQLAELCAELEDASLITGLAFRHDLIYEAVRHATSAAIKTYLHRRVAEALTETRGPAARIAYHYQNAGEARRAAPRLLEAAEEARVRGAFDEAAAWYRWIVDQNLDHDTVMMAKDRLETIDAIRASP